MRVAICLSGHMRTFRQTVDSLRRNVTDVGDHQFDFFIHTWDKMGWLIGNEKDGKESNDGIVSIDTQEDDIVSVYDPKALVIEEWIDWSPRTVDKKVINWRWVRNGTRGEHIYGMYYKIKRCNELKTAYELENGFRYDCVMRVRPDMLFGSTIDLNSLDLDSKSVHMPRWCNCSGANDQLAIASSDVMDKYSSAFDKLDEYVKQGCHWRPENLLLIHLHRQKLNIRFMDLDYLLLRPNGIKQSFEGKI